jgi:hypothetical protein
MANDFMQAAVENNDDSNPVDEKKAEPSWIAKGTIYKVKEHKFIDDQPIPINENENIGNSSANTPMGNRPFGKPVDANAVIYLMADFMYNLKKYSGINILTDEDSLDEKDEVKKNFKKWIINLINVSFGMTFNKNIILKIISQPCCEYLRMYLCTKSMDVKDGLNREQFLSLALVGVDRNFCDLHYDHIEVKGFDKDDQSNDLSIDTMSLSGEYGHPPTLAADFSDKPGFVLYNLARKLAKNWDAKGRPDPFF